jgi:hypothetical protein
VDHIRQLQHEGVTFDASLAHRTCNQCLANGLLSLEEVKELKKTKAERGDRSPSPIAFAADGCSSSDSSRSPSPTLINTSNSISYSSHTSFPSMTLTNSTKSTKKAVSRSHRTGSTQPDSDINRSANSYHATYIMNNHYQYDIQAYKYYTYPQYIGGMHAMLTNHYYQHIPFYLHNHSIMLTTPIYTPIGYNYYNHQNLPYGYEQEYQQQDALPSNYCDPYVYNDDVTF